MVWPTDGDLRTTISFRDAPRKDVVGVVHFFITVPRSPGATLPFRIPSGVNPPKDLDELNSSTVPLPDCTPDGSLIVTYCGLPRFGTQATYMDTKVDAITKVRVYKVIRVGDQFTLEVFPLPPDATPADNPYLELAERELLPIHEARLNPDSRLPAEKREALLEEIFPVTQLQSKLEPPGKNHHLCLLPKDHDQVTIGLLTPVQLAAYKNSIAGRSGGALQIR